MGKYFSQWTESQIETLKEHYPVHGANYVSSLVNKTPKNVRSKAYSLQIKAPNKGWTVFEDNILREFYPKIGIKVKERLPSRSVDTILSRASLLDISSTVQKFSSEDLEFLRANFETKTYVELANSLNRDTTTIIKKCRELGLIREKSDPIKTAYFQNKSQASRRGLENTLSFEDFKTLTTSTCVYCGEEPKKIGRSTYARNGIDRVNNKLGYIPKNCVSCCGTCNKMKSVSDVTDFIEHCSKIINFYKGGAK